MDLEKVITLNADGSGTLVETGIVTNEEVKRREETAKLSKEPNPDDAAFKWIDEIQLRERAPELGEGVTFVSAKRVSNDKGRGWTATYAFPDINKLKLDQNLITLETNAPRPGDVSKGIPTPIQFKFHKGSPAELTVNMTAPAPSRKDLAALPPPAVRRKDETADLIVRILESEFKDARIAIMIDFPSGIIKTDARFHEGRRVTLMDLDFNKLRAEPGLEKKVSEFMDSPYFNRKIFAGVPGAKVDLNNVYHVLFAAENP
jgi:hypothetical protein